MKESTFQIRVDGKERPKEYVRILHSVPPRPQLLCSGTSRANPLLVTAWRLPPTPPANCGPKAEPDQRQFFGAAAAG
eukprot:278107-Rhodomonas_salina.4